MTALDRRIRSVRAAIAASATAGRGDQEVGAVVLTHGEHVESELIGELGLFEQLAHPLLGRDARGKVGERGKPKLHATKHSR